MDFIHGNSLIFGNARASVSNGEECSTCDFCNTETDSAIHQISHCTELMDETHGELTSHLNNQLGHATSNLIKELIFPMNNQIQLAFIKRIDFLKGQHESILGLDEGDGFNL